MCGRTACTLSPDDICHATNYRGRNGKLKKPAWKDAPGGKKYYPSHNIAPSLHTPVMVSRRHYPAGEFSEDVERVIQPMKWGLVPSWHKGDPYKLEYETNNCRAEGMLSKKTYKIPLEKGRRCVVLSDGFFEWKRDKDNKQPYFIYFPDDNHSDFKGEKDANSSDIKPKNEYCDDKTENKDFIKSEIKMEPDSENKVGKQEETVEQCATCSKIKTEPTDVKEEECKDASDSWGKSDFDETSEVLEEWKGKKLLTVAGVFEVWKPRDGSDEMYSYSIITVDSSPAMAWIHHRMPAVLSSDAEVEEWLDFGNIPLSKACKLIRPTECITMHPVSSIVNNSRNKSPQCVVKIDPQKPKKSASSSFMMSWLGKGKPEKDGKEPPLKKSKTS